MREKVDLLNGPIYKTLVKMSLPLMGTAFIQMAYSFIDLIWLGKLSTDAVAAVGTCGFFVWIANSLMLIGKTGVSVGLSQAYGRGNEREAKEVFKASATVNLIICIVVTTLYLIFKENLVDIFHLDESVKTLAIDYFVIVTIGLIFLFANPVLHASFLAKGNSFTPFIISIVSLITNIVLDPILIFGIGPFPQMGVKGAALATVLAQAIGFFLTLLAGIKGQEVFVRIKYFSKVSFNYVKGVLKLGVPACAQSIIHALVSLYLNIYIASYGAAAIAAYSIGSQIESIAWMSSEGFASAFAAFFGQNYGAKKFDRLKEARKKGIVIICLIGGFATILLFTKAEELFTFFIPIDKEAVRIGAMYLMVIAPSELFMTLEIGTTGMMSGLGLTRYPALVGLVFNAFRIPMAKLLMPIYMVNGIWAAMSLSSILKGIFLLIGYEVYNRKTNGFTENMSNYITEN